MRIIFRPTLYIGVLLAVLLTLAPSYHASKNANIPLYQGMQLLDWPEYCLAVDKVGPQFKWFNVVTNPQGPICKSKWFSPTNNYISVEYRISNPQEAQLVAIQLEQKSNLATLSKIVTLDATDNRWTRKIIALDSIFANQDQSEYRLSIPKKVNTQIKLKPYTEFFSKAHSTHQPHSATLGFLAVVLLSLVLILYSPAINSPLRYLSFLGLTYFLFYHSQPYFRGDEALVITAINDFGFDGIIRFQNEHFKPIYRAYLGLLYSVFGAQHSYFVLCSVAIHSLNTLLLFKVVNGINESDSANSRASTTCALVYLLSGVHSGSIQWIATSSQLLSICTTLFALSLLVRKSSPKSQYLAIVICLLPILCFTTGMLAPLQLAVFYLLLKTRDRNKLVLWTLPIVFIVSAVLYYSVLVQSKPSNISVGSIDLKLLFSYFFFSFSAGTIFRGLGLSSAADYKQLVASFPSFLHSANIDVFFLLIALIIIFTLAIVYTRQKDADISMRFFTYGLFWIISTLALVAIGRYHLGVPLALRARYHTYSLIGLSFLLFPLALSIAKSKFNIRHGSCVFLLGLIFLFNQVSLSKKINYNIMEGAYTRENLKRIDDHIKLIEQSPKLKLEGGLGFFNETGKNIIPNEALRLITNLEKRKDSIK